MIVEISEIAKASRAGLVAALMIVTMIVRTYRQGLRSGSLCVSPIRPSRKPCVGVFLKISLSPTTIAWRCEVHMKTDGAFVKFS